MAKAIDAEEDTLKEQKTAYSKRVALAKRMAASLSNYKNQHAPTTRKDVTPLNRKPGGLMEQNNASLQRGDQG
jgi:hypothetical protein